ncbi:hypothetical protein M446_5668 [Methylobacterium sp. 4-46]|nr:MULTISPECIES: hypothetical protein [Methylobacterium]ACA19961.1 hypothetical protein M446_5668 [Methylobacterium sp. 4-46]WFT79145.1 hypothetical protein QA634_28595 [Methylobacterium nodulans]
MVRRSGRDVNERRPAVNATRTLEEGWAETRRNLFVAGAGPRGSA